jgi:hypothetical protein
MLSFFPSRTRAETVSPEASTGAKASKPESTIEHPDKTKEPQEKEYWCKRSAFHKKRIEQAQSEIDREEALLSDLKDAASEETGKNRKYIDKKIQKTLNNLANAHKLLKDREKDLARIEDEAHKKNIPPGWLQCEPVR